MARNPNDFLKSYHVKGQQVVAYKRDMPKLSMYYFVQMAVFNEKLTKTQIWYKTKQERDLQFDQYNVHSARRFIEIHTRWAEKC